MELSENKQRMARGELYHCFTPELVAERDACKRRVDRFNDTRDTTRRHRAELWRDITQNHDPMPPLLADPEADAAQFDTTDPWIQPPLTMDYGYSVQIAAGAFLNSNASFVDTCLISIGARTLVGPNCSFYSGTHPLDPVVRNGMDGPETGKPILIGEDCWLAGNVTVLPGVTVGRGAVVGAGSVVTKDVPAFHVVAGNPARILRRIETAMDPEQRPKDGRPTDTRGPEEPMARLAKKLDVEQSS